MKRFSEILLLFLILLLLPDVGQAGEAKKISVGVDHQGNDQVGISFAFALKEAIRASQSFRLENKRPAPRIVTQLMTMETSPAAPGLSSAIAVAITYDSLDTPGNGIIISLGVQTCGRNQIESCAKKVLPNIDNAVEWLRKNWPSLWKTL